MDKIIIDALLQHLQENGHDAIGWQTSRNAGHDSIPWITITRRPPIYISMSYGLIRIRTKKTHLSYLDPANPAMFDQLDVLLK